MAGGNIDMDTQDLRLAIAHVIVSELGDVGKTKLQKLVYFLQAAHGIPTRYPFKMHHYGPYSEALETDVARLSHAGYVNVSSDRMGLGFHITLGQSQSEGQWHAALAPHQRSIRQDIGMFGEREVFELELAATIHFVKALSPQWRKDRVIATTQRLKPKFTPSFVEEWYDRLEQRGLL